MYGNSKLKVLKIYNSWVKYLVIDQTIYKEHMYM